MKKRGFGAGLWNGFGGKVGDGEGIEAAARRELYEESGITAKQMQQQGLLHFLFPHAGDSIDVHVFMVNAFDGEPYETEEMRPQWFALADIPFEQMWTDDPYWFPLFLEGKQFEGSFTFDEGNVVVDYVLSITNDR